VKKLSITVVVVLFVGVLLVGNAVAVPIQWSLADGGNDHWYDYVASVSLWGEANTQAQTLSLNGFDGHLATVTSVEENSFIWDNLSSSFSNSRGYVWLGGYQTQVAGSTDPTANWNWVTGEEWSYTNWATAYHEPNDGGDGFENGQEDYLQYYHGGGQWNDLYNNWRSNGFVVEYETAGGPAPVPEPATMLLFGTGLVGLVGSRFRKNKK